MTTQGPQPPSAAPTAHYPELEAALKEALTSVSYQSEYSLDELVVTVPPQDILAACRTLKEHSRLAFDYVRCISGVDWGTHLQVVYHLWSMKHHQKVVLKVNLPPDNPRLASATSVWRGADWHEREAAELFGIVFEGHPSLQPLLLYEGFEGYPLRKSFPQGVKPGKEAAAEERPKKAPARPPGAQASPSAGGPAVPGRDEEKGATSP
ncbi:MAG: NADH-quinone oxidoreductase subunit C [Chloroflexi bacterium]|nr:NADH-quinone oxidoreductase subunit C [Chloroflexota bacterium]